MLSSDVLATGGTWGRRPCARVAWGWVLAAEAIVAGDSARARQAAEQHLLGFSTTVRAVLRAPNRDSSGRSIAT